MLIVAGDGAADRKDGEEEEGEPGEIGGAVHEQSQSHDDGVETAGLRIQPRQRPIPPKHPRHLPPPQAHHAHLLLPPPTRRARRQRRPDPLPPPAPPPLHLPPLQLRQDPLHLPQAREALRRRSLRPALHQRVPLRNHAPGRLLPRRREEGLPHRHPFPQEDWHGRRRSQAPACCAEDHGRGALLRRHPRRQWPAQLLRRRVGGARQASVPGWHPLLGWAGRPGGACLRAARGRPPSGGHHRAPHTRRLRLRRGRHQEGAAARRPGGGGLQVADVGEEEGGVQGGVGEERGGHCGGGAVHGKPLRPHGGGAAPQGSLQDHERAAGLERICGAGGDRGHAGGAGLCQVRHGHTGRAAEHGRRRGGEGEGDRAGHPIRDDIRIGDSCGTLYSPAAGTKVRE